MISNFEQLFAEHSTALRDNFARRFLFIPVGGKTYNPLYSNEAGDGFGVRGELRRDVSEAGADGRRDGSKKFRTRLSDAELQICVLISEFPENQKPKPGDVFQCQTTGKSYRVETADSREDGWIDCEVCEAGS